MRLLRIAAGEYVDDFYFLLFADEVAKFPRPKGYPLPIHCEGGLSLKHPDLKYLLVKGYLEIKRVAYGTGWGGDYKLRHTTAQITNAGRDVIARRRL